MIYKFKNNSLKHGIKQHPRTHLVLNAIKVIKRNLKTNILQHYPTRQIRTPDKIGTSPALVLMPVWISA